ncbi:MAG: hypothetical protein DRP84_09685 [Spirochaetes bacterium]|nr:MAG: hypothetical protein DRP84_09685 [Spirochaetota bacterium]
MISNDFPNETNNKKIPFFYSLHFKLILIFTLLVTIITLTTGITLIYRSQKFLQEVILEKNLAKAKNLQNKLNNFLQKAKNSVETITMMPGFKELDLFDINKIISEATAENEIFDSAVVLNKEGIEIVSQKPDFALRDRSNEKIFKKTIKNTYISDVHFTRSGLPQITIASPIIDYDNFGKRIGVLVMTVNLFNIWSTLDQVKIGKTGIVFITDKKGNLIYHTDRTKVTEGKNLSDNPVVKMALENQAGSGRFTVKNGKIVPYDKSRRLTDISLLRFLFSKYESDLFYTYIPLNNDIKGSLIIQQTAKEALSEVINMKKQSLYLLCFSILLAFAIGLSLAHKISNPLKKLLVGTKIVARGNLKHRIDIKSKDEIGKLAESFNNMTKELLKQQMMAITDELTQLYTHSHFYRILKTELSRAKRYRKPLSLLLLDIDHFKLFNDNYGHQAGNIILKRISEMFKSNLRKSDIPARYGGDEFVVIAPESNQKAVDILAERIRQKIANEIVINYENKRLKVTVSIGTTTLTDEDIEKNIFPNDFFKKVDKALYKAKAKGGNCVVHL